LNSFLETLKQLGPARLAIMGGVLAGLVLFFIFVSMRMSTPSMKTLYTDLASNDSAAMATKLDEAKITYDVSPDGTKISVPENEVGKARMLLAQDGLPNGGSMGYEIFDKQSGFGTTNFVQNINNVRALEGELARTIGSLQQIRSARVQLVLPERELFSRDSQPASASVFVTVRAGARLEKEQILAIQSLVASAVPELKADHVAIVDSAGDLLARGQGEDENASSGKDDELQRDYENRETQTIQDIVGRIVGYNKVRANVTVDMNFDSVTTNQESYNPDQQVARSTQTVTDKSEEHTPSSSTVSVQNNLPGIAGATGDQPTSEANRTEETTNFEISKTVTTMQHQGGDVKRQSVAVLVDGDYTTDDKGVKTYKPRSDAELKKIDELVKTAIGYDEKRGDNVSVVNMQFADVQTDEPTTPDDKLFGFEKSDLLDAVEIITVAIMVILVILLVLQPMVGRLLASEGPALGEELEQELLAARAASPQLMGPDSLRNDEFRGAAGDDEESLIDMQRVEGKVKASSVKKVEDIVENYPAETVSVIRSWMSQES
jgi:flagellar M-ring protein FliF